jgi:YkoY family integral membrane protein
MSWTDVVVQDAAIVGTLILLEAVLSFDNAAVLAAMVRRLPPAERRKALLYGLVGAYVLRIAAILLASFLIETPILKVIGGGYLVFIAVKHFVTLRRHQAEAHDAIKAPKLSWLERLGVPALVAVIIQVELVDIAFAIDQVVAAVAFTDKISLIIIASMLGILFLRLAASLMARIMDWLPILEHMAYIAVAIVGLKLVLTYPAFSPGGECFIPFLDAPAGHVVGDGDHPVPEGFGADVGGTVADLAGGSGQEVQREAGTVQPPPPEDPDGEAPPDNGTNPVEEILHTKEGHCEIPTPIAISITLGLFGVPVLLKVLLGIPKPRQQP